MNKWIFISLSVVCFIFLQSSCSKCGDNVRLGNLNLEEVSLSFAFYDGNERLVFADSNGLEVEFEVIGGLFNSRIHLITKSLCEDTDNFADFSYEYYEQQELAIQFFALNGSPAISMILSGGIDQETADDPRIYDRLFIECEYQGNYLGTVNSITSDRGNQISQAHRDAFIVEPEFVDEFTVHNKTFLNCYFFLTDEGRGFYYTKNQGIVAMKISEGEFLHLVRIE